MKKLDKTSIGKCGEYFVAAELERNGFTAALTLSNTTEFDILAINRDTKRKVAIQVKTNHTKANTWTLSSKNEEMKDENCFYVFVTLNEMEAPRYFIVNSKEVAESISLGHQNWLKAKAESGKSDKDTSIRKFSFDYSKYNAKGMKKTDCENRWDLMK